MTSDRAVALQEAVRVQIEKNGQSSDPHLGDLSYAAISYTYKAFIDLLDGSAGMDAETIPVSVTIEQNSGDYLEK